MFWIYNKKLESTKIRNNKIEFDIRDGLSELQRTVLFAVYFVQDSPKYEDTLMYEDGLTFEELLKELKSNKVKKYTDAEIKNTVLELSKLKYPLLSINEKHEICLTRIFDKLFEGQGGTDYTHDSVLSSVFPNLLCNGGGGYYPHEIKNVFTAIENFIGNRNISDKEIHKILEDDSEKDLKKIVEAFVNHRINVLGRLNRIEYDRFDKLARILKFGTEKEKKKLGRCLHRQMRA